MAVDEKNLNKGKNSNSSAINKKSKTSLEIEGDFQFLTEHAEKFIEYLLNDRRHLLRKPTSLKLEGIMEKKTETAEQFKPYELEKRPPLCKKFTNLHLEGDLDIVTEKQEKFKPYQVPERPVIRKKSTNLHLEGALTLSPEYRSEYVNHKNVERTKLVLPTNNLKPDGSYEDIPQTQSPFVHTLHPVIPHLRESVNSPCPSRPCSRPPSGLDRERRGTLHTQLSRSHQNLFTSDTRMDILNKNAYIDGDDRCKTPVKTRRAAQQDQTRPKTPSRDFVSSYFSERSHQHQRKSNELFSSDGELDFMTIKNGHLNNRPKHKSELCIREPELSSADGRFVCQPEYRRAYVDYLIRERIDRKPRTIDFLNQHKMRVFNDSIDKQFTTTTASSDNVPTSCKNKPTSASSTSLPLPPKSEKPKITYRSYSQIEEEAFGPRLSIPRRTSSSSRSSSPSCRRRGTSDNNNSCHSSAESDNVPPSKYKKFASPVKVENIACKQSAPGARSALPPARSKWMRDDSTQSESAAAFYILDDKTDKHRSYTDGNLNRVDKWSPKWHKHGK